MCRSGGRVGGRVLTKGDVVGLELLRRVRVGVGEDWTHETGDASATEAQGRAAEKKVIEAGR